MTVFGAVRAGCQGLGVARMFADDSPVQRIVSGWVRLDPWSNLDQSMGGVVEFSNGLKLHCHNDRVSKRGLEVIGALAHAISGVSFNSPQTLEIMISEWLLQSLYGLPWSVLVCLISN